MKGGVKAQSLSSLQPTVLGNQGSLQSSNLIQPIHTLRVYLRGIHHVGGITKIYFAAFKKHQSPRTLGYLKTMLNRIQRFAYRYPSFLGVGLVFVGLNTGGLGYLHTQLKILRERQTVHDITGNIKGPAVGFIQIRFAG